MKHKNKIFVIIIIFLGSLVFIGINKYNKKSEKVSMVEAKINAEAYYKFNSIQKTGDDYADIQKMLSESSDKYAELYTFEAANDFSNNLNGVITGVGIQTKIVNSEQRVDNVIENSPAQRNGIKKSDIIVKVNDKYVSEMIENEFINSVRGPENTIVKLQVQKESELTELNIKREKIKIQKSFCTDINDVEYINVQEFTTNISNEIEKCLQNSNKNKKIIDLRNNGGGLVNEANKIIEQFGINEKVSFKTIHREQEQYITEKNLINLKNQTDYEIIVLVNNNTASAAEMLTGYLKADDSKTKIIGNKTYGKGSMQTIYELDENSIIKYTIKKWVTPNDTVVDEKGISPDIELTDYSIEEIIKYYEN